MEIILNNEFNIVKTTDENIIKGSNSFDDINLIIPKDAVNNLYPTVTYRRADGRTFGPTTANSTTNDDTNYTYTFNPSSNVLAVEGVLEFTFTINFEDSNANVIKTKNVAMCFTEIYDAVISGNMILVGGEEAVENVLTIVETLQSQTSNNSTKIANNENEINKIKQSYLKKVEYDASTYKFIFTKQDDSTVTYDLPIESLVDDVVYKDHIITFTMADQATTYKVDLTEFYHPIVEANWDGISDKFSLVSENNNLTNEKAILKVKIGSITIDSYYMANENGKLIFTGSMTLNNVVNTVFFITSNRKDFIVRYEYKTIPNITASVEGLEPNEKPTVKVTTSDEKDNVDLAFALPRGYDGYGVLSLNIDDNGDLIMRTDGIDGHKFSINCGNLVYSFEELNKMMLKAQTINIKDVSKKQRW